MGFASRLRSTGSDDHEPVHSARLNRHEPHAYLKDIMPRLPTQPASRIGELLPHRWQPLQA
jgi:transposase